MKQNILNSSLSIEQDNYFKKINTNNILIADLKKVSEQEDDDIANFPNFIAKNMIDSFNFEDCSIDEKMNFLNGNNNNENIDSFKEGFSSHENQNNDFIGKKRQLNNGNKNIFKKNRNNSNNKIFKILKDQNETNNNLTSETSSNNLNNNKIESFKMRPDSLLIKFKSFLGKCFISHINNKLKNLTKRRIKFFSFNYKKFTLNVSYEQNQKWLNEQMKYLLKLGGEPNQIKNEKALKSLEKRKELAFNEIKYLLELTYKDIIERFYLSKYFEEFKKDENIIKLNENFTNVMNYSLLEPNGFISFIYSRKGNKKKFDEINIWI